LPDEVASRHRWDLPLLSDDAKKYYLPAWLTRAAEDPKSDYADSLVYALSADHRWMPSDPYTEEQWAAITSVLKYLAENADEYSKEEITKALQKVADAA